jgi:putative transposase
VGSLEENIMTGLKHYDNLGTARFITFSCHNKMKLLYDDRVKNIFLENLIIIINKYNIRLLAYVIMSTHVHFVIIPPDGLKIGKVIGELKSISARKIIEYLHVINSELLDELSVLRNGEKRKVVWMRRCYDHNCRTEETVNEKINYCHYNPVRAGLVKRPADYKWSSYSDIYVLKDPTASGGAPGRPTRHNGGKFINHTRNA